MTPLATTSWLGHEFDDFLFATVGEDSNGLLLSVVSILGRSNVDPWEEAASLAALPEAAAVQRFSVLLGALPEPALQRNSHTMAARLIALLPQQGKMKIPLPERLAGAAAATPQRAHMQMLLIGIYLLSLLGAELLISHLKAAHSNANPESESSTTSAHTLPKPHPQVQHR